MNESAPKPQAAVPTAATDSGDLVEQMVTPILLSGLDGEILAANRAACELYGYEKRELHGSNFASLRAGSAGSQIESGVLDSIRKQGKYQTAETHRGINGAALDVLVTISFFRDRGGKEVGLLIHILNYTEQQRQNDALRQVEKLYKMIVDTAHEGIWVIDAEEKTSYVNQRICDILGYDVSELMGRPVLDFIDQQYLERARYIIDEQRRGNRDFFEFCFKHKSGADVWLAIAASPLIDENGAFLGSLGMMSDITMRKNQDGEREAMHAALLEKNAELEVARKKFEDLYDNAPCGYHTRSLDGTILDMNQTELDWLGYERDELVGCKGAPSIITQDCLPTLKSSLQLIGETGEARGVQLTFLRKDGSTFPVSLDAIRVFTLDGTPRIRASVYDITEQKKTEQILKARQEEIEALNANLEERVEAELARNREKDVLLFQQARLASIGEMVGNIAHQWRQPLNALQLLLVNIKDAFEYDELTPEVMETSLSRGRHLVNRMSDTIDDFRHFFKPNKARETFAPADVVAGVISIVSGEFRHHSIEIDVRSIDGVLVDGFPGEYSQVLLNLLGNARDAIVENGVSPGRIEIALYREGDRAVAEINDNGGGISGDILPRIFEPYFSTKDEGKGTGIGLYMSKMIIEDHMHGRLEVRSCDGRTQFRIVTPLPAPAENSAQGA